MRDIETVLEEVRNTTTELENFQLTDSNISDAVKLLMKSEKLREEAMNIYKSNNND